MFSLIMGGIKGFVMSNLIKVIGVIAIGLVIGGAFLYWNWSQKTIQTLRTNQVILENAVEDQQQTINSLVADFDAATEILKKLMDKNTAYSKDLQELYTKFTKNGRSLRNLAREKPGLIEKIINDATADAIDCNEALTRGEQCKK